MPGLWYQLHILPYIGRSAFDAAVTKVAVKRVNASELPDQTACVQDIE